MNWHLVVDILVVEALPFLQIMINQVIFKPFTRSFIYHRIVKYACKTANTTHDFWLALNQA